MSELRKSTLEFGRRKFPAQTYFSPHTFQGWFLQQTKARAVPAQIIDGRAIAAELRADLTTRSTALQEAGIHPRLLITLVGENESSIAYVRNLEKTGARIGIEVVIEELRAQASAGDIRACLSRAGSDPTIHGVLLQQPLPEHLAIRSIADAMPVDKDVDGTHPTNQGHLAFGSGTEFVPATPAAVMLLLERSTMWPLNGRRAVMIGRSVVVGLPVATLMLAQHATVTVLHKESASLQPYTKLAEIVVVATGVPDLITGDMIAPGATVIDVGTTVVDGVLRGDVEFASVSKVAGALTPVPGGVGPVTNVALMRNVIKAASRVLASRS
ncbi:MAG: bifunctional 5,10-methylenetetrahydrofolate dehydrogenase/5,10-methenyltetrahydrofolate cyclohydrolase [Candidatus Eremiobacteraeota bacterium]|nr:bifunctional 5,10-methylenetetrahydrofolate dehydrogenase/5,10-methenyltetrahydrofolate cyclohydrolase [Candidatus Eremiobacteraeota bacterium]